MRRRFRSETKTVFQARPPSRSKQEFSLTLKDDCWNTDGGGDASKMLILASKVAARRRSLARLGLDDEKEESCCYSKRNP